jgi:cysteine-rich repeat protein
VGTLLNWRLQLCVDTSVTKVCGNGVVESGEACDDANLVAGDGCNNSCQMEFSCAAGQTPTLLRSSNGRLVVGGVAPNDTVSAINFAGAGTVRKAVVLVEEFGMAAPIEATLRLQSPAGTQILLSRNRGPFDGEGFASTFFDDLSPNVLPGGSSVFRGWFRPEAPLSGVDGQVATGTWLLRAEDRGFFSDRGGLLGAWTLGLCVE